jgi:hypothetical protein
VENLGSINDCGVLDKMGAPARGVAVLNLLKVKKDSRERMAVSAPCPKSERGDVATDNRAFGGAAPLCVKAVGSRMMLIDDDQDSDSPEYGNVPKRSGASSSQAEVERALQADTKSRLRAKRFSVRSEEGAANGVKVKEGKGTMIRAKLESGCMPGGGVIIEVQPKCKAPHRFASHADLSPLAFQQALNLATLGGQANGVSEDLLNLKVVFRETNRSVPVGQESLPVVESVKLVSENALQARKQFAPDAPKKLRKRRSVQKPASQHDLALVIKKNWLDLILTGQKTWEIRGVRTSVRRVISLAQSGSGHLVGEAKVINCIPLELADLPNHVAKHCVQDVSIVQYRTIFAWELQDAWRYPQPRPYNHPMGAVTWVRLPKAGCDHQTVEDPEDLPLTSLASSTRGAIDVSDDERCLQAIGSLLDEGDPMDVDQFDEENAPLALMSQVCRRKSV